RPARRAAHHRDCASAPPQPPYQDAGVPAGLQVGEDDGDGLADDAAAVDGEAVFAAQDQAGVFEVHELLGGDIDGDLLVVPFAAAGAAVGAAAGTAAAGRGGGLGDHRRALGGLVRPPAAGLGRGGRLHRVLAGVGL